MGDTWEQNIDFGDQGTAMSRCSCNYDGNKQHDLIMATTTQAKGSV